MASNDSLQDEINVTVTVEKAKFPKTVYKGIFNVPEKVINWKLDRAKREIAPNVGRRLAQSNQQSQRMAISVLDAVMSGDLLNSITIKGGRGVSTVHYRVGTSLKKLYPQAVVFGRPSVSAKAGHFLKFTPKGESEPIFRKSVKASTKKNYPAYAQAYFEPTIRPIIEREVSRVLKD